MHKRNRLYRSRFGWNSVVVGAAFLLAPGARIHAQISLQTSKIANRDQSVARPPREPHDQTVFISLGDSLTHGTMDGTNNSLNTLRNCWALSRCDARLNALGSKH